MLRKHEPCLCSCETFWQSRRALRSRHTGLWLRLHFHAPLHRNLRYYLWLLSIMGQWHFSPWRGL